MTATETPTAGDVHRHPQIEAWLDDRHVTWTYDPHLDLTLVDVAKSLANQARLEPLDADVVDRYAADMRRGDQFPPIVVYPHSRKKLLVLGGNHRHHAALKAGLTGIPAYIVDVTTEPETVLRLTYEDNRRHGLPPSDAERIVQAIHLIDNGWTQEAAAACVGVPAPRISTERTVRRAADRADTLGADPALHKMAKATRYALAGVRSDPVYLEAANLVVAVNLSVTETQRLVKAIDASGSDNAALTLIGSELEDHRSRIQKGTGSTGGKVTARAKLQRALAAITALDLAEVAASTPNADVATTVRKAMTGCVEHLDRIQKALPR